MKAKLLISAASFLISIFISEIIACAIFLPMMSVLDLSQGKPNYIYYFSDMAGTRALYRRDQNIFRPAAGSYKILNHIITFSSPSLNFSEQGVRGAEGRGEKVLIMGDSITAQDYLSLEDSWVFKLGQKIGDKYTFLNGAVPSYGFSSALPRVKEITERTDIKHVIHAVYLNDLTSCCAMFNAIPNPPVLSSVLLQHLNLKLWYLKGFYFVNGDLTLENLNMMRASFSEKIEDYHMDNWHKDQILNSFADWGNAWAPQAPSLFYENISGLKDYLQKKGISYQAILLPHRDQSFKQGLNDWPQTRLAEKLEQANIKFIDPLKFIVNSQNKRNIYFDHCHFEREFSEDFSSYLAQEVEFERLE